MGTECTWRSAGSCPTHHTRDTCAAEPHRSGKQGNCTGTAHGTRVESPAQQKGKKSANGLAKRKNKEAKPRNTPHSARSQHAQARCRTLHVLESFTQAARGRGGGCCAHVPGSTGARPPCGSEAWYGHMPCGKTCHRWRRSTCGHWDRPLGWWRGKRSIHAAQREPIWHRGRQNRGGVGVGQGWGQGSGGQREHTKFKPTAKSCRHAKTHTPTLQVLPRAHNPPQDACPAHKPFDAMHG